MIRPGQARSYRARLGIAAAEPISAGIAIAADAAKLWMSSIQTSHNAMTATTLIVNGLEQQLKNLDQAYFSNPARTCADQRAALNAYDESWLWLQSPAACGNPNFGAAGNACIGDRAPNGRWPWQQYYRDPLAHDVAVGPCDTGQEVILPSVTTGSYQVTDITSTGGSATTGTPAAAGSPGTPTGAAAFLPGISNNTLIVVSAALLAGLVLSGGKEK